jgi:hypothetical protein
MYAQVRWDPEETGVVAYMPDGAVVVVPEIGKASWQGYGPVNLQIARIKSAQREGLRMRRLELTGHCTPQELDPTGSYRMVADRLKAEREQSALAAKPPERLELPEADAAAARQADAKEGHSHGADDLLIGVAKRWFDSRKENGNNRGPLESA